MFTLSWRLSLVNFIALPILLSIAKVYGTFYRKLARDVQDSLAKVNEIAEESVSTIKTVRSFATEMIESDRHMRRLGLTKRLKVREAFAYAGFVWCNQLFDLLMLTATLAYGARLVMHDLMAGGNLVSFVLYQMELSACLDAMSDVYTGLMTAIGASEKVFEYMDREPTFDHTKGIKGREDPTVPLKGHIEFRDVCFSYPTRSDEPVLKNVNFTINPGEVVALVGPSGGGKSSCFNLLQNFYRPDAGHVLLDGIDISEYDHRYVHTKMSIVNQEPVLYATTVRDNIAYGMEGGQPDTRIVIDPPTYQADVTTADTTLGDYERVVSLEVVREAAKLANADEFIMKMADEYESQAGERGSRFSGGQKQRIAIARAIIRKPNILLLDEATSSLDSHSEYLVQEALYKNLAGRTVLIIAHRLSTVQRSDRIIVIDQGRVVEQGSHDELLASGGMYHGLVNRNFEQLPPPDFGTRCVPSRDSEVEYMSISPMSGQSYTTVSTPISSSNANHNLSYETCVDADYMSYRRDNYLDE